MQGFVKSVVEGYIIFLFFAGLLFYSLVRAGKKSRKKARAVLLLTLLSAVIWADYYLIDTGRLPMAAAFLVPAALFAVAIAFRRTFFPYKGHCEDCGKRLSITEFLSCDEHLCAACYEKRHPETVKIPPEERIRRENEEKKKSWAGWQPQREFVIVFAFDERQNVLLLDRVNAPKKPGKLSGVIGAVRASEDPAVTAGKALRKDTGLVCETPEYMGRLNFVMPDMNIRFHVFVGRSFTGTLNEERDGVLPVWLPLKKLNYDLMSMDYPLWLPRMLRGQRVEYYAKCNAEGKIYEDILDLDAAL